jgi:hypothetical protein
MSFLACLIVGHDLMHPHSVDTSDKPTVKRIVLESECRRCFKTVRFDAVDLTPNWRLSAKLRRQAPWARERSRRTA